MLRQVSVSEEHRALMVTVVEKVLSAKSGLNEAFMSLLRGFEVCDIVLLSGGRCDICQRVAYHCGSQ